MKIKINILCLVENSTLFILLSQYLWEWRNLIFSRLQIEQPGIQMKKNCTRAAFFFLLLLHGVVNAQTNNDCSIPAQCANIKVEMVRVYDNLSTSCPATDYDCTDAFHQMAYKVYLRYQMPAPGIPGSIGSVNLNYKSLDVGVSLSGNPVLSKINIKASMSCFENSVNGHFWKGYEPPQGQSANKPLFEVTENAAIITFRNDDGNTGDCGGTSANGGGNMLIFNFNASPPPNVDANACGAGNVCAYLELFTVIADAYPGEAILLKLDNALYSSKSSPQVNCEFGLINTGQHQAAGSVILNQPSAYTGTNNQFLEARIGMPSVTNVQGQYELPILLTNTGSQNAVPEYVEFLLEADVSNLLKPFGYSVETPSVTETPANGAGTYYNVTRKLHYKINLSGVTIVPGTTNAYTICKIILGPAEIENLGWDATFQFIQSGSARIKGKYAGLPVCTNLKTTGSPVTVSNSGSAICANYNIRYFSRLVPPAMGSGSCNNFNLQVGLQNFSQLPNGFRIAEFEVKIKITDPNVTFGSSINTSMWPTVNCSNNMACGATCYTLSQNNTEFRYCFKFTNPSDAILFFQNNTYLQYFEIPVNIPDGSCLNSLATEYLAIKYFEANGVGVTCLPFPSPTTGTPQCPNGISGKLTTALAEGVQDATVTLSASGGANCTPACQQPLAMFSTSTGDYGLCQVCTDCAKYIITPTLNLDPLNGVNTYDLILISRHILGLEPLNSPYKIISADANKSGTVTTFDIVDLRKLILGTFTELPNNSSWRFIDATQVFPQANNPFADMLKENRTVLNSEVPAHAVNFIACKIGDVDLTATPNNKNLLPVTTIGWNIPLVTKDKLVTIPVYYSGNEPAAALQFALSFNPGQITFIAPSGGAINSLSDLNFGLTQAGAGRITFSWHAMDLAQTPVQPGAVLFNLTFRVVQSWGDNDQLLQLASDDGQIPAVAWQGDGTPYRIESTPAAARFREDKTSNTTSVDAQVIPNPADQSAVLRLQSTETGKIRFAIMNAYGQRLTLRDVSVSAGTQDIPLQEVAALPAGVYQWWIKLPSGSIAQGQFVVR